MLAKLDFTYLYIIPLLLSAIFSLKSFWLKWPKHLRIFSIFLFVTLTLELFAIIWKWDFFRKIWDTDQNIWIYNISMIAGRTILLLYFYQLLSSTLLKKTIARLMLVFLIFSVVNYFFFQKPQTVNTYSVGFGSVLVIFFCIRYFMELLNANEVFKLRKLPEFWIAIGTFIYYLWALPFIIGFDFLARDKDTQYILYIFMQINDVLTFLMYTLYLIAFLCRPHPKLLYKQSSFPQ